MKQLKTFLALLLSIVCFVLLLWFTGCYTVKHYINSDVIKKTITDADFSDVLNNIYQENEELLNNTKKVFEVLNIPEDAISQVINSDATKNFLSIYVANSVDAILGSDEEKNITKDDLKTLIKDNLDIIQREMPNEEKAFLENYENVAYNYIDEYGDEIISYFPTPKEIISKVNQEDIKIYNNLTLKDAIKYLNILTSSTTLIIEAIIIGVILLLIYVLKRKIRWAKYYTFIFGLYSILMTMVLVILTTFVKNILVQELNIASLINYVIDGISKMLFAFIIGGSLLTVISLIFYIKKKELLKNAQISNKLSK